MYWISDPGHAWLRVPIKKLFELGLADKISTYSYLRNQHAYLEEDNDAWVFLEAIGKTPKDFKDRSCTNNYSRIRNYYLYDLKLAHILTRYKYKELEK